MGDVMSGAAPVVTIGIVTYNAPDYVGRCLASIRENTELPHEVVVVDNASDEPTRRLLRNTSGIRLIQNEQNRLWCPALNQAFASAHPASRFFLMLNPDVEVLRRDWLARLIDVLESHPRTGITGVEHNFRPLRPTWGAIDGHCLLVRREVFEHPGIGPLDEALPWNGSPFVLTARAKAHGWSYRLHPPSLRLVIHHGGRSRAEARTPMPNRRVDHADLLTKVGLRPRLAPAVLSGVTRQAIRWGVRGV